MQNAIPQCSFYGIKVLNLMGSFSAVLGGQLEKLWQEFFCVLSNWDRRSEKVTEHHSCQSSFVNGAIALVGVNCIALSWLLFCHVLNFGRNSLALVK
jgi:hypothetical protein